MLDSHAETRIEIALSSRGLADGLEFEDNASRQSDSDRFGRIAWQAAQHGIEAPLPENSMDVDPITSDDEIAELCYEAHIGSAFERENGWHIKLMPASALEGLPEDWKERSSEKAYGKLVVVVPSPVDLLVPKLKRGEARDQAHAQWARLNGLVP